MLHNLSQITHQQLITKNSQILQHQNTQIISQLTTMRLSSTHAQNIFQLTHKQKQKKIVGIICIILTLNYTTKIQGVISATNGFLTTNLPTMFSQANFIMHQQIAFGVVVQQTPINLVKNYKWKTYHHTIWLSKTMETYAGVKFLTTLLQCRQL